jgi:predicted TIM-barrel fold metal-dependent hydrolase
MKVSQNDIKLLALLQELYNCPQFVDTHMHIWDLEGRKSFLNYSTDKSFGFPPKDSHILYKTYLAKVS